MGIEKAKSYTAYLSGGITFKLEVRENGITDLTAYWANSEPMELDELCLHPEDFARMGELFTLAGSEVNA
jgi:hypothetical protein